MKLYDARFVWETLAVLFEQRRTMLDTLEAMSLRLEELEGVLEPDYPNPDEDYVINNWDGIKIGLDADGACECGHCTCGSSYRMD